jgi:hypothetical protein
MYTGKLVFAQVMEHIPMKVFAAAYRPTMETTRSNPSVAWINTSAWPLLNRASGKPRFVSERKPRSSTTWEYAAALLATLCPTPTKYGIRESTPTLPRH